MNQLAAVCDSPEDAQCVRRHLKGIFQTQYIRSDRISEAEPPGQYTIVGVSFNNLDRVRDLKCWLGGKPRDARLIFITEKHSRLEAARAYAFGATDLVHRPIDANALLVTLCGDFNSLASGPAAFQAEASPGIIAALGALKDVFTSTCFGIPLNQSAIDQASEALVDQLQIGSLAIWIDIVRKHHSQTYQHSLLVTGVAVGFGMQLGLSHRDLKRLSFAGILHDIGKARIPVSILEKAGVLDDGEIDIVKQHPLLGSEALATTPGLPAEMIDAVIHHHEYLDGTGYPHGLKGGEISDLVRILTIADIFGALIERRSYKLPLQGDAAYQILLDMGPKLDRDLVREFRDISRVRAGSI
jgi:putative nucleotidyltransferase with HDIG domain